jgi:hypothetical protein
MPRGDLTDAVLRLDDGCLKRNHIRVGTIGNQQCRSIIYWRHYKFFRKKAAISASIR